MGFPTRRQFLRASAASCVPLPFLSSLHGCAEAGAPSGHPLVVVRAASGVAQEDGDEPERFWPSELGALGMTKATALACPPGTLVLRC